MKFYIFADLEQVVDSGMSFVRLKRDLKKRALYNLQPFDTKSYILLTARSIFYLKRTEASQSDK